MAAEKNPFVTSMIHYAWLLADSDSQGNLKIKITALRRYCTSSYRAQSWNLSQDILN